ncbi:MAG: DUF5689 domain-containing protein [Alistipes sp.]
MSARALLVVCALLAAGCYDSSFDEPRGERPPTPSTTTIRALRSAYAGTTFRIKEQITLSGVVTTSDNERNFYRTLCIEDDGAALEIMAGVDHLHNAFPRGCRVTLRLKGLAVGESRGVLQAGRFPAPGSGYATDYIGSPAALGDFLTRDSEVLQPLEATQLTLSALNPSLCGTLVRIEQLHYAPEELLPSTWAGYKPFADAQGLTIDTYVRAYADFATSDIPVGPCSLTGILQYDGTRYQLKLRDERDCAF